MNTRVCPLAAGVMAVFVLSLASGCGAPAATPADPVGDLVIARDSSPTSDEGRRLFALHCAPCHGDEGRGDGQNASRLSPRPPDLTIVMRSRAESDVRTVVASGSAAVGRSPLCPPRLRDIGPAGVDALVAHVRELARLSDATKDPAALGPPSRQAP